MNMKPTIFFTQMKKTATPSMMKRPRLLRPMLSSTMMNAPMSMITKTKKRWPQKVASCRVYFHAPIKNPIMMKPPCSRRPIIARTKTPIMKTGLKTTLLMSNQSPLVAISPLARLTLFPWIQMQLTRKSSKR